MSRRPTTEVAGRRFRRARSLRSLAGLRVLAGLAVAALLGAGLTVGQVAPAQAAQGVAMKPANLPVVEDGAVEAIAVSGDHVFVGGTFTTLTLPGGGTVTQPYLFSYSLSTGDLDTGFRPVLNNEVTALAAAPDGSGVYAGGTFTTVNGAFRLRVAKILLDGSTDLGFTANAEKRVATVAAAGSKVYLGGQFATINGTSRSLLAAVDAATGAVDPGFDLPITDSAAPGGFTSAVRVAVSPDGSTLLVAHNGLTVGGLPRAGLALVDITGPTATVKPWRTDLWTNVLPGIGGLIRITDAAWGPDSSWFVVTNTGGDRVPTNDSVQRFDVTGAVPVSPTWVTRQFDSAYAVAVGSNGAVYTGGHFRYTEAPGSVDPYPGLPTANYSFGPTGGARVLGDQVVGRHQVDALDPATGKALNWAGSADGQHGVTALTVVGDRLLLGHDGNRVGGLATGAHGILQTYGAAEDPALPHTTMTSPLAGQLLEPGTQHLTGTATAPAGVHTVAVEVFIPGTTTYLNPDGSFGAYYIWTATLGSPDAASTSWSLDIPLASNGEYIIRTKAIDLNHVSELVEPTPVEVYDTTATPPTVAISTPLPYQQDFTTRTVSVTGTAADADGVAAVSVSAYNQTAAQYLSGSLTLGDFTAFSATLGSPGGTSTTWSASLTLPNGTWRIYANAVDAKGTSLPEPIAVVIVMQPGNPPPVVGVTAPANGSIVTTPAFSLRGTASDLDGITAVYLLVREPRYSMGLSVGATWGAPSWVPATLSAPGAHSVTWTLPVTLPTNTYVATVYAMDGRGLTTPVAKRPSWTIRRWPAGVTAEPTTTITTPVTSFRATTLTVPVGGGAGSAKGVGAVRVTAYDLVGRGYLQANGTIDRLPAPFTATLRSPGATSSVYSLNLALPYASTWSIQAYAVDRLGTPDATKTGSTITVKVYPGDADPTITLVSPVNGTTIATGRRITMGGRAFDDLGVSAVQVFLRRSDGVGLQADGRLGTATWLPAFVTNTGGLTTNWQYTSPVLSAGVWTVYARAIDSVGKEQLTFPNAIVTLR